MKGTKRIERARALLNRIDPSPEFAKALREAINERLDDAEEWISPGEFARIMGVHPNTVGRWCDDGLVQHQWMPGRKRRILATEVDRLRRECVRERRTAGV